jgi:hypothetical protein
MDHGHWWTPAIFNGWQWPSVVGVLWGGLSLNHIVSNEGLV